MSKKDRYEVIHIGLHGAEWIGVVWDRREKRVVGSAVSKSLDEVVSALVDLISAL